MAKRFFVSSSPHIKSDENTGLIMRDVIISLVPVIAASYFYFGLRSSILIVISVASCMFFELISQLLLKRPVTIKDMSAVLTGILFAFCLPASVPFWFPVVGAFVAIVIVKQLFGGIGKNFVNPALLARVFMMSWLPMITNFTEPIDSGSRLSIGIQNSTATPLALLKQGIHISGISSGKNLWETTLNATSDFLKQGQASASFSIKDMILGIRPGCLGETAVVLLLAGGIFLLYRRIITWHIPATFIGTVAVLTFAFPPANVDRPEYMIFELLSGGLVLGAIYMATDYTTSPITSKGKIIYGIGCGLLTYFIRMWGSYPEGVSYAILIMNLFVWLFDKVTRPKRYGTTFSFKKSAGLPKGDKADG